MQFRIRRELVVASWHRIQNNVNIQLIKEAEVEDEDESQSEEKPPIMKRPAMWHEPAPKKKPVAPSTHCISDEEDTLRL